MTYYSDAEWTSLENIVKGRMEKKNQKGSKTTIRGAKPKGTLEGQPADPKASVLVQNATFNGCTLTISPDGDLTVDGQIRTEDVRRHGDLVRKQSAQFAAELMAHLRKIEGR